MGVDCEKNVHLGKNEIFLNLMDPVCVVSISTFRIEHGGPDGYTFSTHRERAVHLYPGRTYWRTSLGSSNYPQSQNAASVSASSLQRLLSSFCETMILTSMMNLNAEARRRCRVLCHSLQSLRNWRITKLADTSAEIVVVVPTPKKISSFLDFAS